MMIQCAEQLAVCGHHVTQQQRPTNRTGSLLTKIDLHKRVILSGTSKYITAFAAVRFYLNVTV